MDKVIAQNISFLRSIKDVQDFPSSPFKRARGTMGESARALQRRMTFLSTKKDSSSSSPFDAEDLGQCLWWIIDNPSSWKKANFVSLARASPEWKGVVVGFVPLVRELMLTPTLVEPRLSSWVRQITNDSVDPPPHRHLEEARRIIRVLKRQYVLGGRLLGLEIRGDIPPPLDGEVWTRFKSSPQKLTNDLVTVASRDSGKFWIVVKKTPNHTQVLLQENNLWVTKIAYTPLQMSIYLK